MLIQKYIAAGQIALTLCCIFYAVWWYVAYNPKTADNGAILFWLTFACGIAGIYLNICGIRHLENLKQICIIGGAAYILLLAVTVLIFQRQVTAELFLITAFATLEVAAIFAAFPNELPPILLPIVAAVSIFALVAYLLYYKLDDWTAFYFGFLPLILDAICAAVIAIFIFRRL